MNYLHTKSNSYSKFVKENNTDRLSKGLKIFTTSKDKLVSLILNKNVNEIFDRIFKTEYKIAPDTQYKILFNTNNGYEYRLNLLQEKNNFEIINHISFSDNKSDTENNFEYVKLLNRNETIEILQRIHYILKDMLNNDIIDNNFCVGGSKLSSKNNIYEYFLKVLVGDEGFVKKQTNIYETGWALYFKI